MRTLLVALIVLGAALAGCAAKKGDGHGSGSSSSTLTTTAAPAPGNVTLAASVSNGTAPLLVNFTLNATSGYVAWRLGFGDGGVSNGTTSLPGVANHTYVAAGNFSANLTVTYPGGVNVSANVTIPVLVPSPAAPDVTHFEFEESLGCASETGAEACFSFQGGPDASGIDGYWLALDERYWGLQLTSTVENPVGDSDCAFTDANLTILGTANNSNGPCGGPVPTGTAFLFLYPFAAPALGMTADFGTA